LPRGAPETEEIEELKAWSVDATEERSEFGRPPGLAPCPEYRAEVDAAPHGLATAGLEAILTGTGSYGIDMAAAPAELLRHHHDEHGHAAFVMRRSIGRLWRRGSGLVSGFGDRLAGLQTMTATDVPRSFDNPAYH
tara:strand:- start:159 stop:566 length:408 start_codon:yes stop_codon:yes gene_type:complete